MIAFLHLGPMEWGIILVVSLLIFGKRLPSVMKNLGKGIVEFKRGVQGIEDDVDKAVDQASQPSSNNYQTVDSTPPEQASESKQESNNDSSS